LDLDDVRTHVGEHLRAEGAEDEARQVQHPDAVERFGRWSGTLGPLAFELPELGFESGDTCIEGLRSICIHAWPSLCEDTFLRVQSYVSVPSPSGRQKNVWVETRAYALPGRESLALLIPEADAVAKQDSIDGV